MISKCHFVNNHICKFEAISPMSCNKTMIKVQLMGIVQGAQLKVNYISYPSSIRAHNLGVIHCICA